MKIFLLLILGNAPGFLLQAQAVVMSVGGSQTMTIKSGTLFGADSLVLTPVGDFTLASNNLKVSTVPIPGAPNNGINRVYNWGNQVNFTGNLQLYYKLSELNGNTESLLNLYDSAIGGFWMAEGFSMVNTAAHYVQFLETSHQFIGVTAGQVGSVLAVKLLFFDGSWVNNQVQLKWTVSNSDPETRYEVDWSEDGQLWRALGDVNGSLSVMPTAFYQNDLDQLFSSRFYRIKILDLSGMITLSRIIRMDRLRAGNAVNIASRYRGARFNFSGEIPTRARVINMIGQAVWQSQVPAAFYEVSALVPGVYLLEYEISSILYSKKFIVQ